MTDDELNEAIHQIVAADEYRTYGRIIYIPDYANDLNASMREIRGLSPGAHIELMPTMAQIHRYDGAGGDWSGTVRVEEGDTDPRRLARALLEALEDGR